MDAVTITEEAILGELGTDGTDIADGMGVNSGTLQSALEAKNDIVEEVGDYQDCDEGIGEAHLEEGRWMSKTELEAIIVQSCLQASSATSTQLESRLWQLKKDYAECLYTSSKLEREIEDNAADFEAWSEVICKLHTKEPKSQQEKKIIDDCLNMRRHYAAARRKKAAQMT